MIPGTVLWYDISFFSVRDKDGMFLGDFQGEQLPSAPTASAESSAGGGSNKRGAGGR